MRDAWIDRCVGVGMCVGVGSCGGERMGLVGGVTMIFGGLEGTNPL